jgi:hypothetical protein
MKASFVIREGKDAESNRASRSRFWPRRRKAARNCGTAAFDGGEGILFRLRIR